SGERKHGRRRFDLRARQDRAEVCGTRRAPGKGRRGSKMRSLPAVLAVLALSAPAAPRGDGEARISMDVKDAPLVDVVRLLAEVGGFQVVFDPGIDCKLTLKLNEVTWPAALDVSLRSCGLGRDEESGSLRVASLERLA